MQRLFFPVVDRKSMNALEVSRKPVLLRGHPTLTMTFESTYFGGVPYTPPAKMPGEGALYGHQKRWFLSK